MVNSHASGETAEQAEQLRKPHTRSKHVAFSLRFSGQLLTHHKQAGRCFTIHTSYTHHSFSQLYTERGKPSPKGHLQTYTNVSLISQTTSMNAKTQSLPPFTPCPDALPIRIPNSSEARWPDVIPSHSQADSVCAQWIKRHPAKLGSPSSLAQVAAPLFHFQMIG